MRLHVLTIGKPRLGFARAGIEEYLDRFPPKNGVEVEALRSSTREEESKGLLAHSEGMLRVVLDERGEQITSRELARKIAGWELQRTKAVAFLIGGADGHTETLLKRASLVLSFGAMTWPHQLARAMLAEQIYRAQQLLAGHPYHRA